MRGGPCSGAASRSCKGAATSKELRPEGWWGWEPGPKELRRRSCDPGVLLNFLTISVKFLTIIARRGAILLNFLIKSAKELRLDLFLSRFRRSFII